jgi:hypothetical protein
VGGSHSQTDLIHISSSTSPTCGGGEGRQSAINQEIQHLSSEIEQAK